MPEEPLPLELRLGLRAGSVFYFESRELTSREPHYFIVVNGDPLGTKLLLLTIVTSQLDKVRLRNRTRLETVVEISPAEYAEFRVESAVDCNVVLEKSLSELVEMIARKQVRYHRDVSPEILRKLQAAIQASPLVADDVKLLL